MIWVLTREYNDYDQHGEYFVHAWTSKPTVEQIDKALNGWENREECEHILNGGGRRGYENSWYFLRTVES